MNDFLVTASVFSIIILASLFAGQTYTVMWPRASIEEYARFPSWYWIGVCVLLAVNSTFRVVGVPRSSFLIFILIDTILIAFILLTGTRAVWRLAIVSRNANNMPEQRVLIVGAGEVGTILARDILRSSSVMCPVGFIDDDPNLRNMTVASLKVLGGKQDISTIIKRCAVDTVLIAIPSATGAQMKEYVEILSKEKVTVRVLPSMLTLADGQVNVSRLRSVNLEDLLRREPIKLDDENIKSLIGGKTVLVTGAGGSIGSEICRQLLARQPEKLLALGHGEQSIYLLMESLAECGNTVPVIPIIADIADETTMKSIFERFAPQVVLHAGAHKHVPLMEDNPREALRVNAYGTWNIATLAGRYNVERFVMISTDKAVHPTSVMGATKRAAERLLLYVQQEYPRTKYMAVRLVNVLGSRGSVVPKFERQIAEGGPVTVTHPQMKRYFMLIPEAVSLVLQAGAMGDGGELFVLYMGEQVNISDIAETIIRMHGYEPHKDIQIKYTGIRTGEKLYEELFYDPGNVDTTGHAKIFKIKLTPEAESILPTVITILLNAASGELSGDSLKEEILGLGIETTQKQKA
ncbi:MAG: polysaccharide biosynthesis protein [Synergistaceae bacterium]|nr:polysaccharide biosynthesis protein [Synergistaceae bacterium]